MKKFVTFLSPLNWFALAGLLLGFPGGFIHADWPEFRGPEQNGDFKGEVPVEWSEDKNITWRKEIAGKGWSTPLIMDGKIWLTTATEDGKEMSVLCFDEKNGDQLLDRILITNDNPEPLANPVNTYASSTGVIEPGRVYVHFGSYGTICLNSETFEVEWERRDLTCSHWRGPASSLAMWGDKIIVTEEGADQQYFVALDKNTGKTLWRRDRSTDYADEKEGIPANSGDMRKAFSTPIFAKVGDTVEMICNGAKAAWGYDVETGKELWSCHYNTHSPSSRTLFSPERNTVYVNTGLGKAEIWAIPLSPDLRGEVKEDKIAWKLLKRTPKRSSPVIAKGYLFMAGDGVGSCVDLDSGELLWSERMGGAYSASVITNGELVYFFDEDGLATVVKAASEFQKVAENQLDEGLMASPAVSGENALILRTKTHLYRIENQ